MGEIRSNTQDIDTRKEFLVSEVPGWTLGFFTSDDHVSPVVRDGRAVWTDVHVTLTRSPRLTLVSVTSGLDPAPSVKGFLILSVSVTVLTNRWSNTGWTHRCVQSRWEVKWTLRIWSPGGRGYDGTGRTGPTSVHGRYYEPEDLRDFATLTGRLVASQSHRTYVHSPPVHPDRYRTRYKDTRSRVSLGGLTHPTSVRGPDTLSLNFV